MSSKSSLVRISTTANGTFSNIGKVLSIQNSEASGDSSDLYVLGEDLPQTQAGDDTADITLPILVDLADTLGQEVARTARDTQATVYVQLLPGGIHVKGTQRAVKVTKCDWASDPNGTGKDRFVTGTITLKAAGPKVDVPPVS